MDIIRKYPLDVSGRSPDNLVIQEPHELVETPTSDYRVLIPNYGGFYTDSLRVYDESMNPLPTADFVSTYLYEDATELTALEVCGAVVIKNPNVSRRVYIDYQVVGGNYAMSTDALRQVLEVLDNNNRPVEWKAIIGRPTQFPVGGHLHALWELYGFEYMTTQLERITQAILAGNQATMDELRDYAYSLYQDGKAYTDALDDRFRDHKADYTNPHRVTKAQVGLGLVENYRIATNNEIETGSSTSLYLTVAGVVHAIEYHLGRDFTAHVNDIGNPHQVTKAQVGLGSVENYSPSTKSQAEVGTANNRYMTPLRTAEAITHQIGNAFDSHTADYTNPHRVTKAQVGLGSVQNHGLSNKNEAELGDRNDRYMTPLRTSEAITYQIGNAFDAHAGDFGNPHQVTKSQVGLGSVDNFSTSSKAEAEAGTLNNRFMTPLRTRDAIKVQAVDPLNAHAALINNPHSVTKAQVGLGNVENYLIATQAQAEVGTLNTRYMTPLRTAQAITDQAGSLLDTHIRDNNNPHGVTKAQVGLGSVADYGIATLSEARDGTVHNKYMTPLRTAQAITTQVGTPLSSHISNTGNPHSVTKAQVGLGNVDNYNVATQAEAEAGSLNTRYMTPLRTRQAISKFAGDLVDAHANRTNNPHRVTKAQVGLGSVQNYSIATQTIAANATANNYYMTPLRTRQAFGPSFQDHVTNGFNMPRTGATSRIGFGLFKSDPGYIEHIVRGSDSPGEARFRFCVSDDAQVGADTDRFEFGAMDSQNNYAWVNWMFLNSDRMWLSRDLYVTGNVSANNVQFRSDMRYKDDVSPLTNVLEKIQQLSGFDYRLILDNERYTGLSAQEVQSVLPHSVRTVCGNNGEEHLTVNLAGPVALLVEAVKELTELNEKKNKRLSKLEERIVSLERSSK